MKIKCTLKSQRRLRGQRSKRDTCSCRKFAYQAKSRFRHYSYYIWIEQDHVHIIFLLLILNLLVTPIQLFVVFLSVFSDISFIIISMAIQELHLVTNRLQIRIQRLNLPQRWSNLLSQPYIHAEIIITNSTLRGAKIAIEISVKIYCHTFVWHFFQ